MLRVLFKGIVQLLGRLLLKRSGKESKVRSSYMAMIIYDAHPGLGPFIFASCLNYWLNNDNNNDLLHECWQSAIEERTSEV